MASLLVTRLLDDFLFGVSTTDPLILGVVAAALLLVARGACLVPAFRVSRLDPSIALRD